VQLSGASFGYAGCAVVSRVDLEIDTHSMLGIVGPNGAGKSTVLRGILGLLPPMAGSRQAQGERFGYVPQSKHLDPIFPVTLSEVVEMGAFRRLSRLGRLRREDRQAVRSALERVGLADLAGAAFAELSGGQRQRALLARALLTQPNLLVLDEPTSGVDRQAEAQIGSLLERLHAEGIGVVMVSHQLAFVRAHARAILFISRGRAQRLAPAELSRSERLEQLFQEDSAPADEV
jgi:manganese/iron transport system ATP-binding protein